jgi:hypothetical protein
VVGDGYWNYPLNGETDSNQYRSFLRKDTIALIKYAAAKVSCQAENWAGNGGLLGLGDMSESNGAIPGTSINDPGHPAGTHVNGFDIDIAYYQVNTADNKLRAVCPNTTGNQYAYHCVGEPHLLDVWRTALYLAHLHDASLHNRLQLRVVGVDGRIGPLIESAITQLCNAGWYQGNACNASYRQLAFETTNANRGWYYHHHHHFHVSISGLHRDVTPYGTYGDTCFDPQCLIIPPEDDPRRFLYDDH